MTKLEMRTVLLNNAKKMCEYVANELEGYCDFFQCKYGHGFVYGYSSYNISVNYSPSTKKAEISINFYHGHDLYIKDGNVYDGSDNNRLVTNSFLNNYDWYKMTYMEEAIMITQKNWSNIKSTIAKAKQEITDISDFKL